MAASSAAAHAPPERKRADMTPPHHRAANVKARAREGASLQTGGRLSIGLVRWGAIYRAVFPKSRGSVAEATLSAAPEACSPHTRSKMVLCAGRRAIAGRRPRGRCLEATEVIEAGGRM